MISVPSKPTNFSVLHNEIAQRTDLSARAKGIYFYLATLPLDWKLQLKELENHFTEGRTAISTAFKELIHAGYVEGFMQRTDGLIAGYAYSVKWTTGNADNQVTEKPITNNQKPDNQQLLNTNKQSTNKQNIVILTDNAKTKKRRIPTKEEVSAEFIIQGSSEYEAEKFFNYYDARSWMTGKTKITKWKSAAYGWIKRENSAETKKEFEIKGEASHDEYNYGF